MDTKFIYMHVYSHVNHKYKFENGSHLGYKHTNHTGHMDIGPARIKKNKNKNIHVCMYVCIYIYIERERERERERKRPLKPWMIRDRKSVV